MWSFTTPYVNIHVDVEFVSYAGKSPSWFYFKLVSLCSYLPKTMLFIWNPSLCANLKYRFVVLCRFEWSCCSGKVECLLLFCCCGRMTTAISTWTTWWQPPTCVRRTTTFPRPIDSRSVMRLETGRFHTIIIIAVAMIITIGEFDIIAVIAATITMIGDQWRNHHSHCDHFFIHCHLPRVLLWRENPLFPFYCSAVRYISVW